SRDLGHRLRSQRRARLQPAPPRRAQPELYRRAPYRLGRRDRLRRLQHAGRVADARRGPRRHADRVVSRTPPRDPRLRGGARPPVRVTYTPPDRRARRAERGRAPLEPCQQVAPVDNHGHDLRGDRGPKPERHLCRPPRRVLLLAPLRAPGVDVGATTEDRPPTNYRRAATAGAAAPPR